jgi:UDP-glucuronate 4-epimerase
MLQFVALLEQALGRRALVELLPPQATEMQETCADITAARAAFGYAPRIALPEGLARLVAWYRAQGAALLGD